MDTSKFDEKLNELKLIENEIKFMEEKKEEVRKELFETIKNEDIRQYKNEIATVSIAVIRKLKFNEDEQKLIEKAKSMGLENIVITIPAKEEFDPEFLENVKSGDIAFDGIEVEVKTSPRITFNK